MSKSRKFSLAAILVAGGYLAALVFGGVPELVLPAAESPLDPSADLGWLSGVKNWMAPEKPPTEVGQLVAESAVSIDADPTAAEFVAAKHEGPTWLRASTEPSSTTSTMPVPPALRATHVASHPEPAAAPTLLQTPLVAAPIQAQAAEEPKPGPKARITEVRPVVASSQPAASPWDRWPRWPTGDGNVQEGAVPATFQDLSTAPPKPQQAAYHESEVVRKNSPPLDPGAKPVDALRTHVVIDGDTLTRLAERYLDDPERSAEIYRLNRDVLTNPELLPIGVELRIPARERPGDALAALSPTGSVAVSEPRGPDAMVPVPWSPKAFEEAPHARLLQPIPTGHDN
ncbi:MAG: LysM peptidoglycan-binding domain-containing protein [Pirellulales bacterium]